VPYEADQNNNYVAVLGPFGAGGERLGVPEFERAKFLLTTEIEELNVDYALV
jgi:hypothetical protein